MGTQNGCGCTGGGKRSSRKTMRKGPSSRAKKLYRKRVKGSKCRGMMTAKCRSSKSCKMALGKKRSFCRKAGNTKRPRYNLRSRKTMKGGKLFGNLGKKDAINLAVRSSSPIPEVSYGSGAAIKYGPGTIHHLQIRAEQKFGDKR